eukprot:m.44055 g.44055  ORF g.44055 m.44055 type:complete len:317 (+) comp10583_c0_seq1:111-1061(+)
MSIHFLLFFKMSLFSSYSSSLSSSLTVWTKGFVVAITALCLLSVIPRVYDFLSVAPSEVVPPLVRLWKIVTASYVEKNFILAMLDVLVVVVCATGIDPVWGGPKLVEMLLVVNAVSIASAVLVYIGIFAMTSDINVLFTPFCGFSSGIVCLAVAYKQCFSQASVSLFSLKINVQALPLLLVLLYTCLHIVGVFPLAAPLLSLFGFLWGWSYLRFFQVRNGIKGDDTDEFSFDVFFPSPLRPFIRFVAPKVYVILRLLRLCPSRNRSFSLAPGTQDSIPKCIHFNHTHAHTQPYSLKQCAIGCSQLVLKRVRRRSDG